MFKKDKNDINFVEIREWLESINSVINRKGMNMALNIISFLIDHIKNYNFSQFEDFFQNYLNNKDYINTIPLIEEITEYPGDIKLEEKILSIIRWNALMLVLRASKKNLDLGGHIASFQSSAVLYEVCFNHFFIGNDHNCGDLIYFQGHIAPGIYSRAFIEGRITENQMNNFRQETNGEGLSSYPHPKLMPNFWQFPTVSMGLGAICSIYQAKFLKYLNNKGLKNTSNQTVYAFLGDGEMDEPESKGAITIASRENLDNLIFVINCNLQRLDGPVFGNGKIINELESIFFGAGWKVIKVLWDSNWDKLFKRDSSGKLVQLLNETIDGDYQNLRSKNGAYIRENLFNRYLETKLLVKDMSDDEIWSLGYGGHDYKKVFSAFYKAKKVKNKPVVILVKTIKGYGMGSSGESQNIAHQVKKFSYEELLYFRDRFDIPLNDKEIINLPFLKLNKKSPEYEYLHERRKSLMGYIPVRRSFFNDQNFVIPTLEDFRALLNSQDKEISTTISFVRIINILFNKKLIRDRIVLIVADEARTFGMEGLFRKIGIYSSKGQKYTPQDSSLFTYYREDVKGQIFQEGISELGAGASWLASSTSYSSNNFPIISFYIYYSIFGFQRIGDLLWAAGDQQARGFLIGGTSGRTTLNGEGLQHEDGHSHIQSLTIPNCISYNPAYAYELAVIIQNGIERMYGEKQENVFYYITTLNENYKMPKMPLGAEKGICKGIYKLKSYYGKGKFKVQLLGSGSIVCSVIEAARILLKEYNINSDIYSVTSFTELAREGQDCIRWNMLHPLSKNRIPYIAKVTEDVPTIASTDYMKIFAEQVRPYLKTKYYSVLGTDGYGRSDSRKNLRSFFEIDCFYIVIAALFELSKAGFLEKVEVLKAIKKFNINSEKINPSYF